MRLKQLATDALTMAVVGFAFTAGVLIALSLWAVLA